MMCFRGGWNSWFDVLIHSEHVLWIIFLFQREQAFVFTCAISRANAIGSGNLVMGTGSPKFNNTSGASITLGTSGQGKAITCRSKLLSTDITYTRS